MPRLLASCQSTSVFLFVGVWLSSELLACGKPSSDALYLQLDAGRVEQGEAGSAGSSSGGDGGSSGGSSSGGSGGAAVDAGLPQDSLSGGGQGGDPLISDGGLGANGPDSSTNGADACTLPGAGNEICDGLDNDCDGLVDEAGVCDPGCVGFVAAERAYMFCAEAEVADNAQSRCRANEMRLVWLESRAEISAVVQAVGAIEETEAFPDTDVQRPVRIGASDSATEASWAWGSPADNEPGAFFFWTGGPLGEPVNGSFVAWADRQPNNNQDEEDCGALLIFSGDDGAAGEWNDVNCASPYAFVCETP